MNKQQEALKLALEALESANAGMNECHNEVGFDFANEQHDVEQAITAIREALAEQPASKPWVGLDEEEIEKCCFHADSIEDNMETWEWTLLFYEAVATKLREKNA